MPRRLLALMPLAIVEDLARTAAGRIGPILEGSCAGARWDGVPALCTPFPSARAGRYHQPSRAEESHSASTPCSARLLEARLTKSDEDRVRDLIAPTFRVIVHVLPSNRTQLHVRLPSVAVDHFAKRIVDDSRPRTWMPLPIHLACTLHIESHPSNTPSRYRPRTFSGSFSYAFPSTPCASEGRKDADDQKQATQTHGRVRPTSRHRTVPSAASLPAQARVAERGVSTALVRGSRGPD